MLGAPNPFQSQGTPSLNSSGEFGEDEDEDLLLMDELSEGAMAELADELAALQAEEGVLSSALSSMEEPPAAAAPASSAAAAAAAAADAAAAAEAAALADKPGKPVERVCEEELSALHVAIAKSLSLQDATVAAKAAAQPAVRAEQPMAVAAGEQVCDAELAALRTAIAASLQGAAVPAAPPTPSKPSRNASFGEGGTGGAWELVSPGEGASPEPSLVRGSSGRQGGQQ